MFIADAYISAHSMQNSIDLTMTSHNKCKFSSYMYNTYFTIKQHRQERTVLRNVHDSGLWLEMMNTANKT